jgi:pseudouridine synthase
MTITDGQYDINRQASCMWLLNKPVDVETDIAPGSDLWHLIPNHLHEGKYHHVGRLDKDTSGLLLFTNKGEYTYTILNSKSLKKTYLARVGKAPTAQQCQQLVQGVSLKDGMAQAVKVSVLRDNEENGNSHDVRPLFLSPRTLPVENEYYYIRLTTCDGRYRVVRRMLAAVGLPVLGLHRESIGHIKLSPHAIPGSWEPVEERVVMELLKLAKGFIEE